MAHGEREYVRLPGKGRTLLGSVTLWCGWDHLLLVEIRGFTENYRRFHFRDIQAVVVRRTDSARVRGVVLGLATLALAAVATASGAGWNVFWWGVTALVLAVLLVSLARGPSCTCLLQTALQKPDIRSLRRLRVARRVVQRIRPLIGQAQGSLTPHEMLEKTRELDATLAAPRKPAPRLEGADGPPVIAAPTPPALPHLSPVTAAVAGGSGRRPRSLRHDTGRLHEILCYGFLLAATTEALQVFARNLGVSVLGSIVGLSVLGGAIAALARQQDSDLPSGVKMWTWTVLGSICFKMVAGFVFGMYLVFHLMSSQTFNPSSGISLIDLVRKQPALRTLSLISALVSLTLALSGLVLLRRLRQGAGRESWLISRV